MKKKHDMILKYEERVTKTLAERLTEPKQLDFGIKVLLPILFFIDYAMIKMNLKRTQANLLFTKKLALSAAKSVKEGGSRIREHKKVISETDKILKKDKKGVYSKLVRDEQIKEIDLLIDHYLKLLDSEGKEYKDLVRHAYGSKDDYFSFLKKLGEAEERVNQAAINTLKEGSKEELRKWFDRMETTIRKVRMEEINKIFPEG